MQKFEKITEGSSKNFAEKTSTAFPHRFVHNISQLKWNLRKIVYFDFLLNKRLYVSIFRKFFANKVLAETSVWNW